MLHSRGCTCNKSLCVKNYCECYAGGVACTQLCKCQNCKNVKSKINEEEKEKVHEKNVRKKKKKSCQQFSKGLKINPETKKKVESNKLF